MAAVAAMPSVPGMRTSMRTTSACDAMAAPAAPSAASPTTLEVGFRREDHAEADPDQGLVVDQQDADHAGT